MKRESARLMTLLNVGLAGFCAAGSVACIHFYLRMQQVEVRVDKMTEQLAALTDADHLRRIMLEEHNFNVQNLQSSADVGFDLTLGFAGIFILAVGNAFYFRRLGQPRPRQGWPEDRLDNPASPPP